MRTGVMKKGFTGAALMMLILILSGCGAGKEKSPDNIYEIDGNIFELAGSHIMEDYDGDAAFVTTWKFTNNTDEATSSTFILFYQMMQGDTELDDPATIFISEDSYDTLTDFEFNDVQPGETGTFFLCYKLIDKETPVSLRVSDLLDEEVYETEISIAGKEMSTIDDLDVPAVQ